MDFTSDSYSSEDFRKEEELFTQFHYSEVSTAPGLTWCTEYHYRKLPNGGYQFVMIDSADNELYCHREYSTAKEFADDIKEETINDGAEPYLDDEILSLFPEDIRKEEDELIYLFNEVTADLLHDALEEGDRELVKAFLPDFSEFRARLYPAPYIPGISARELERRRNLLRTKYRSEGYVEEKPDVFIKRGHRITDVVEINKYSVGYSTGTPYGSSQSGTILEDLKELPNEQ